MLMQLLEGLKMFPDLGKRMVEIPVLNGFRELNPTCRVSAGAGSVHRSGESFPIIRSQRQLLGEQGPGIKRKAEERNAF